LGYFSLGTQAFPDSSITVFTSGTLSALIKMTLEMLMVFMEDTEINVE